ncbi:MAG TPA: alpha-glucosidase [Anaerolineales bacterium]
MTELKWWQRAVFYQIYPRSFADGNGDGIGDFPGMFQKLDYLQDLGIDAVWLSPHYPSPQFDCGYDITDYKGIAPEYGTLSEFNRFIAGAHQRGIRVILDLVLNHTSHEHPWFIESRSSRHNPKRNWYVWKDGKVDDNGILQPPNNWNSTFDGIAWEFDPPTNQYYYHYFLKQQPDLNWHNPEVKREMWDSVRFWLDLGVDGFRLDAISTIYERPEMPKHPLDMSLASLRRILRDSRTPEEHAQARRLQKLMFQYQNHQPGLHELMQELRSVIDEYDDCVLVAEDDDIAYMGNGDNELHLVFNFPLMRTSRLTPAWVRANQKERLTTLASISPSAWPCNTLGNHDSPRVYSHFGDGKNDQQLARISLALMLTLRGTPFLYYGEEIGMTDNYLEHIDDFRDLLGTWQYQAEIDEFGTPPDLALQYAAKLTRDKNRTPMQWENSPNSGFSPANVRTWLPVNTNYDSGVNVADQAADPASLLKFYQRILSLRKNNPALIGGDYLPLHEHSDDYLAFLRRAEQQTCLVVLNMVAKHLRIHFDLEGVSAQLLFSSQERQTNWLDLNLIQLSPFEILIAEMI